MLSTLHKCLVFLTSRERWRWAFLIPLALVAALMETWGAAAAYGLVKIIGDPTQVFELPFATIILSLIPSQDSKHLVLIFGILVAAYFILKNCLLVILIYVQTKIANDSIAALSGRMLKGYLTIPYAFHFRRNTAELIRNATISVDHVFGTVMLPAVHIVTEALIVAGIVSVLVMMAPSVTLVAVAILLGLLVVSLKLTQRYVARWGARLQEFDKVKLQHLQQSLGGIKEVKIMGRERFFYDAFSKVLEKFSRIKYLFATLGSTPRLLVETVVICGMFMVMLLVILGESAGSEIIPLLGLYGYAAFRVIPSANRIVMHVNSIRFGTAAVNQLYADITAFEGYLPDNFDTVEGGEISFQNRLSLNQVSYSYDGAKGPVLQDVNLEVRRGECIGIVGPTGAGKTTLIDLILGLLAPSGGQITVDDRNIQKALRGWQRKIGYVPQTIYLTDDTLRRNIAFGLPDQEIEDLKIENAVQMAQLEKFIASLPEGIDTVVGERGAHLSGGERQRVAIARALYEEPELLVFDEATSALDNQTEREVMQAIDAIRGEKTLIIVAHRLSTVRSCDWLVYLCDGRIDGCGTFDELMQRNLEFRRMAASADRGAADT